MPLAAHTFVVPSSCFSARHDNNYGHNCGSFCIRMCLHSRFGKGFARLGTTTTFATAAMATSVAAVVTDPPTGPIQDVSRNDLLILSPSVVPVVSSR